VENTTYTKLRDIFISNKKNDNYLKLIQFAYQAKSVIKETENFIEFIDYLKTLYSAHTDTFNETNIYKNRMKSYTDKKCELADMMISFYDEWFNNTSDEDFEKRILSEGL